MYTLTCIYWNTKRDAYINLYLLEY